MSKANFMRLVFSFFLKSVMSVCKSAGRESSCHWTTKGETALSEFTVSLSAVTLLCVDLVPDPCSFEPESEVAQLAEQMKSLLETAEPADDCIQLPTSSTEEARQLEVSRALQAADVNIGDRVFIGGVKVSPSQHCTYLHLCETYLSSCVINLASCVQSL